MLLAYIDEIGETGAFVSPDDKRYNTSAAFGYGGFIIPADSARAFGAEFTKGKRQVFAPLLQEVEHPGRWEFKGSKIFRPTAAKDYPQQLRMFDHLVKVLKSLGGQLFYYADEKPRGTPRQTALDPQERETQAMRETLNRLARFADTREKNLLVMIDQINEKERAKRLAVMYAHIFSRSAEHPEMQRIIEPPMHMDSVLSANVQFADWVAAAVSRAIDYQLIRDSKHAWIVEKGRFKQIAGSFTHESKLHFHDRALDDIVHSKIFRFSRPLHPEAAGHLVGQHVDPLTAEKMRGIAGSASARTRPDTR